MGISKENFLELKREIEQAPFSKRNIAQPKSTSISYWTYRLLRPFYKFKYNRYQKANRDKPWLTPDANKALQSLLNKDLNGLEFGSGRSTQFFANLLGHLVSIEHHEGWYEKVKAELEMLKIDNVEYQLAVPNQKIPEAHFTSEEQHFLPAKEYPIEDTYFEDYLNLIDEFEDNSFDFILVDGRARKSCALRSISKLKSGGIMVLDNAERVRYQEVHQALKDWDYIYTTTGLTDTKIWLKP